MKSFGVFDTCATWGYCQFRERNPEIQIIPSTSTIQQHLNENMGSATFSRHKMKTTENSAPTYSKYQMVMSSMANFYTALSSQLEKH